MIRILLLVFVGFSVLFGQLAAQSRSPYYQTVYRALTADGLTFSEEITPIAQHVSSVSVLRMPSGKVLLYGLQHASPTDVGTLSVAESNDGGRVFSAFRPIVIPGTPAKVMADPRAVIHTDGRIRLYYLDAEVGTSYELYSAISTDGMNFTHDSGIRLLRTSVMSKPDLIRIANRWNLYVTTLDPANRPRLARATSVDGISFTWDASFPGFDGGQSFTASFNNTVRTYYVRDNFIGSAVTSDGRSLNAEAGPRLPNALSPAFTVIGGTNVMYFTRQEAENTPPIGEREEWSWNKPVIGRLSGTDPQVMNPTMADVIRADDGTFRMYYAAGAPGSSEIRVAVSGDGLNWTFAATVLRGSGRAIDRNHTVNGPRVIQLPDGRFRMYYNAYPAVQGGQRAGSHVRSAISVDGFTFREESGVRMEIYPNDLSGNFAFFGRVSVFALPDGTYGALVNANPTGDNTPADVYFANSTDGLTWENYRRVYTDFQSPFVIRKGNTFIMYANYGTDYTARVESPNGSDWRTVPQRIVLRNSDNSPLNFVPEPNAVLGTNNQLMMYADFSLAGNGSSDHIVYYQLTAQAGNQTSENNPDCKLQADGTRTPARSSTTSDGSITVTASGGILPYSYALNNEPGGSANVFRNLSAGNYTVLVRDAVGCTDRVNIAVNAFNTGGNDNTEGWNASKLIVGTRAGNEAAESGSLTRPGVIRLKDNTFRLYYNATANGKSVIKWAFSSDGQNWQGATGIALEGNTEPADREFIIGGASAVQLPDGKIRLYYQAAPAFGPGQNAQWHLRSAVSDNGYTFTREQGVRIEIQPTVGNSLFTSVSEGSFYYLPQSQTWAGIFTGKRVNDSTNPDLFIGYSPDGLTWSNYRKLYDDVHSATVINRNGQFILYANLLRTFTGKTVSSDGVFWTAPLERIYAYDLDGNDAPLITDPAAVVTRNGTVLMYGSYFSGSQPFEDHIALYQLQKREDICARQPINLSLTATPSACASCANGVIRVTPTNGQPPYTFTLNGGATFSEGVFPNLNPAEYTISVRDSRGCTATRKVTVGNANPNPSANCVRPAELFIENINAFSGELIWVRVPDAVSYRVGHRLRQPNATFTYVTVPATQTRYFLSGLQPNTTYETEVRTVCAGNAESVPTPTRTFTTAPGQARTCFPTPNVFTSAGATTMLLTWNVMPDAVAYQVSYRETGNNTQTFTVNVTAPRNFLRITGLKRGTAYIFEVSVRCFDQTLSIANTVQASTLNSRSENEEIADYQLSVYPNPVRDFLVIESLTEFTGELTLTDVNGKQILKTNLTGERTEVSTENLTPGVYFLLLKDSEGKIWNRKVIKE